MDVKSHMPNAGSLLRSPEYKKALKADLTKNMDAVTASKIVAVQSLASSKDINGALADPCLIHDVLTLAHTILNQLAQGATGVWKTMFVALHSGLAEQADRVQEDCRHREIPH